MTKTKNRAIGTQPMPSKVSKKDFPKFDYSLVHPEDWVKSGNAKKKSFTCLCCKKLRQYAYKGPLDSEDEDLEEEALAGKLCFFCIADGSANKKLGVSFNQEKLDLIEAEDPSWTKPIPRKSLDVILRRTPSFETFQEGSWLSHCKDAAILIKIPRKNRDGDRVEFRCRHCKAESGYEDWS